MSNAKTIVRNTSYLLVAEIVSTALSFVLLVAMSRHFLETGLGKYSLGLSFGGILLVFTELGMFTFMVKEISKDKSQAGKFFANIMGLRAVLLAVVFLAGIPIAWVVAGEWDAFLTVLIMTLAVFVYWFSWNMIGVFQAYEKMGSIAAANVIEKSAAFLLGIGLIFLDVSLPVFVLTFFFSALAYFFFLSWKVREFVPYRFELDWAFCKRFVQMSLPFWLSGVFISLLFRIQPFFLSLLTDYAVTGWYSASEKLILSLNFIPVLVSTAIFPAMSKFHNESKEYLRILYEKSFKYLLMSILPIALGTALLSERIILFIYGENFLPSAPLLQILIWAEVFIFLSLLLGFLLNAIDKQHVYAKITGSVLGLAVLLDIILIPSFKGLGAAAAFLAGSCCLFAGLMYVVRKEYKARVFRIALGPLVAVAVMGVAIKLLEWLPILVLVPIAALAYVLGLVVLGSIGKEEFEMIKNIRPN